MIHLVAYSTRNAQWSTAWQAATCVVGATADAMAAASTVANATANSAATCVAVDAVNRFPPHPDSDKDRLYIDVWGTDMTRQNDQLESMLAELHNIEK